MTERLPTNLRIDADLRARLYGAAAELGKSARELVEDALRRELRRLERRHGEFRRRDSAPRGRPRLDR